MAVIKPVSFARGRMGQHDFSYLTEARAVKMIEELEFEKAEIESRIEKLKAVKDVVPTKKK